MIPEVIFLILPVLLAGLTFILFLKWSKGNYLNYPLDFGLTYNGNRIFGENKTIKGPLFMILFTVLYGVIIYQLMRNVLQLNLSFAELVLYYSLIGLAYSFGELPNSFLKRQLGIPPGKKHPIGKLMLFTRLLDIFDSLLFMGLIYLIFFKFDLIVICLAILIGGIVHLMTDLLMKSLELKE